MSLIGFDREKVQWVDWEKLLIRDELRKCRVIGQGGDDAFLWDGKNLIKLQDCKVEEYLKGTAFSDKSRVYLGVKRTIITFASSPKAPRYFIFYPRAGSFGFYDGTIDPAANEEAIRANFDRAVEINNYVVIDETNFLVYELKELVFTDETAFDLFDGSKEAIIIEDIGEVCATIKNGTVCPSNNDCPFKIDYLAEWWLKSLPV